MRHISVSQARDQWPRLYSPPTLNPHLPYSSRIAPKRDSKRVGAMTSTILIVDDDPIQRRLLDNTLRKLGYETVIAQGGEEAVALLQGAEQPSVDLVVLDLVMPDLDGMGVLSRLRESGIAVPVIPCLMIQARSACVGLAVRSVDLYLKMPRR